MSHSNATCTWSPNILSWGFQHLFNKRQKQKVAVLWFPLSKEISKDIGQFSASQNEMPLGRIHSTGRSREWHWNRLKDFFRHTAEMIQHISPVSKLLSFTSSAKCTHNCWEGKPSVLQLLENSKLFFLKPKFSPLGASPLVVVLSCTKSDS